MKRLIHISIIFILITGLFSCNRIRNKTERVTSKVKEQTQKVVDKVFPPFDYDKPDTENNKLRFLDFLKIDITPDISQIYCFDDAIGIDASYMFSFKCDSSTSEKIIKTHDLRLDSNNMDNGFSPQYDFDWWDKERIAQLDKYTWTNGEGYHKYYWYDHEEGKAYFFDFDM